MKLEDYIEENYTELTMDFMDAHPELGILDDDMADLGERQDFTDFCENKMLLEIDDTELFDMTKIDKALKESRSSIIYTEDDDKEFDAWVKETEELGL